jgi:hypothetical protein
MQGTKLEDVQAYILSSPLFKHVNHAVELLFSTAVLNKTLKTTTAKQKERKYGFNEKRLLNVVRYF